MRIRRLEVQFALSKIDVTWPMPSRHNGLPFRAERRLGCPKPAVAAGARSALQVLCDGLAWTMPRFAACMWFYIYVYFELDELPDFGEFRDCFYGANVSCANAISLTSYVMS